MSPTPHEIQTKEFREAFRGYHQDDVDNFLDELADEISRITQENQRLRVQVAALQQEVARVQEGGAPTMSFDPQSKGEAREEAKRALSAAQSAAESLLQEARAKADHIIAEAERAARERAVEAAAQTPSAAIALDPESAGRIDEIQFRIEQLERQEVDVRSRLRALLEGQLEVMNRDEAETHQRATVARMTRELGDGGDEPEPDPRRFWTEPKT